MSAKAKTVPVLGAYLEAGMRVPLAPGYWGTVESIEYGDVLTVQVRGWEGKKEGDGPTIPPSRAYLPALELGEDVMRNPDREAVARLVRRALEDRLEHVLRLYDGMHAPAPDGGA